MKPWLRGLLVVTLFATTIFVPRSAHAIGSNPSAVCSAGTCTVTFTSISDYYSWNAPRSDTYTLEVWGAQGGNAGYNGTISTYGGLGGFSSGTISLTANQTVYIYVGAQGTGGAGTGLSDSMAGGYNGGGYGYNGASSSYRGSGGGGGSDIRIGGTELSNRVIIAGGGGGGVGNNPYGTNYPGIGGGTNGGNGYTSTYNSTYTLHGKGGTQSAGGAGGSNGSSGTAGALGTGGNAGSAYSYGEGGGGGGYYGGGASGSGMGSGGGSGYIGGVSAGSIIAGDATMTNPTGGTMIGRSGNGLARITYPDVPQTSTISSFSLTGNALTATYRTAVTITAVASVPSKITFKVNNVIIPGCKGRQTTGAAPSSQATCSWKPSTRGSAFISAVAVPNNATTSGSSAKLAISISNRSTKR